MGCMYWQPLSFLLVCRVQQIRFINFVLFHFYLQLYLVFCNCVDNFNNGNP